MHPFLIVKLALLDGTTQQVQNGLLRRAGKEIKWYAMPKRVKDDAKEVSMYCHHIQAMVTVSWNTNAYSTV